MNVIEAKGAMDEILRRHHRKVETDAAYRRADDALHRRQVKAVEKAFMKGGAALKDLRSIPGFKESEDELRVKNAMQSSILEARDRSRLKQKEIAERMGIPASNVCRIEHSGDAITFKTFSAYLRACGFSFSIELRPATEA